RSSDDMWWGWAGTPDVGSAPPRQGEITTARGGAPPRMPPLRKLQPQESRSQGSQLWRASEPLLGLSEVTWQRIRADPRAARLVKPVWSRLDELERAGHDPGALAALRYTLTLHQPTHRGTCRFCRWRSWPIGWWRRRWPCATWIQVRAELFGDGILPPGRPTVG
ncbi:MAG: hypothetical protein ACRDS9_14335, partial [Pseudonocardiaceae bacterium]